MIGVLGPLAVLGPDGVAVPIGSGRQRRLLAALALHEGADVPPQGLAELVWGDTQPADPAAALHTLVARVRRLLPPAVSLTTGTGAYRLTGPLDSAEFAARLARSAPDPAVRLADLDAALALWRGRPFADLDHPGLDHPDVEVETTRLHALRAAAVERRAEALLETGRADEAVAALATAETLSEVAAGVLMRAHVAAGRPADAARVFARLRAELAEQLGVDPAPELVRLHERLLRHEIRADRGPGLPVSAFLGRDADVSRIAELLDRCRLVTLCGPGGVGKTRLARHVAAAAAAGFDDGVLIVDLAPATPDTTQATVAGACGTSGSGDLTGRIVEVLAVRRQLLVLDNCEHVADVAAALVEAVAAGAPQVAVLATSREALRADGEQVVPVPPLPARAAAELLVDRIRAADPTAEPDPDLVATACARLDGLPLALELAAARAPAVGLRALIESLDEPLDALGRGRRTAPARHRSLREVVEWSFRLLDARERELFVGLGVFAGAVEPGAVATVCGDVSALPDLVGRSLVVRHDGDPVTFGMLETVRAFGRSHLAADPRHAVLRARHAAWVVALAEDLAAARSRADEAVALRRFDAHLAEVRRAHEWLCAAGPMEDLLRLALVCAEIGYQRARVDLGRMADDAVAVAGGSTHPLLPRVLALTGVPRWQRGDLDGARERGVAAIALAERIGDPLLAREAHEVLANVELFGGDLRAADAHTARSAELSAAAGDDTTLIMALCDRTVVAAYAGDDATAARHEAATLAVAERMGSPLAHGWAAYAAGERRAEAGLPDAALHLERAVALAEEVDAAFLAGVARHTLVTTAARADPAAVALARFGPLLDTWLGMGSWTQLWIGVRALAEALSRLGRHHDAAVLLGALRASPRAAPEYGADAVRVREIETAARAALGDGFAAAHARGAAMGDSGAVAWARRIGR
ncbi:BTAD domain-containing putative transcriptional regulator [Pseudonocardia sp.]|uniref:BTAD domain-containing putative transcriptional regulator n=1 Tax=Pseudonocardia sp. TaxID=60912 RepID=UPI00263981BD|nr:BTAD domain-containing putative transcriptional regulator [Pseudonocardia sp.]